MDQHITKVIFRKFKDDMGIIAYFPALLADMNPHDNCLSYMHIGQHGAASIDMSKTLKASESEYENLKKELESIGYNLKICYRFSGNDTDSRIAELKRIKTQGEN